MPVVQMPDGANVQFPDAMPPDQIRSLIAQKFPDIAPTQAPQQQAGIGRTAFDQGMQGATFGFADEIQDRLGAGLASLATGEKYSDLLSEARNMSKERM